MSDEEKAALEEWRVKYEELAQTHRGVMRYLLQARDDMEDTTEHPSFKSIWMACELAKGRDELLLLSEILYTKDHVARGWEEVRQNPIPLGWCGPAMK